MSNARTQGPAGLFAFKSEAVGRNVVNTFVITFVNAANSHYHTENIIGSIRSCEQYTAKKKQETNVASRQQQLDRQQTNNKLKETDENQKEVIINLITNCDCLVSLSCFQEKKKV